MKNPRSLSTWSTLLTAAIDTNLIGRILRTTKESPTSKSVAIILLPALAAIFAKWIVQDVKNLFSTSMTHIFPAAKRILRNVLLGSLRNANAFRMKKGASERTERLDDYVCSLEVMSECISMTLVIRDLIKRGAMEWVCNVCLWHVQSWSACVCVHVFVCMCMCAHVYMIYFYCADDAWWYREYKESKCVWILDKSSNFYSIFILKLTL